jgi:predicted regulator of Ras-like GTPase activity (Roadblock/LC7/MglB family)
MNRSKNTKNADKLQVALDYLSEYSGVRGAVIADNEGLVISKSGHDEFNAELYAALSLSLSSLLAKELVKLSGSNVEFLSIKTSQDWVTIARASHCTLVVAADRRTDDLLGVRISRALEMIATHLKTKYPVLQQATGPKERVIIMEEIHV